MRIAYIVHKFPPESVGGTEIHTWSLARHLVASGHEVHVFYPMPNLAPNEARIEQDGIRLWRVSGPTARREGSLPAQFWHTFRNREYEIEFSRFLTEVRPDIVHFQHLQGVSTRLTRLAEDRPRVLTLHDYWHFCANSQLIRPDGSICDGPKLGWRCVDCAAEAVDAPWLRLLRPFAGLPFAYRNSYVRRCLKDIDLFLTPSEFSRQLHIDQGFPQERIRVLEHGLDASRLVSSSTNLAPPTARPHFGFLGSIAPQKGVHVLIEAFNQLPEVAALTVYGDDSVFPSYAARIKAMARHPHVRFAGPLDYRRIGDALRDLDFLVVPSLWCETFCLVAQEAHAMRVPVVASRLGALQRIRDGEDGRLFAAGDSEDLARVLLELLDAPEIRARLQARIEPPPTLEQQAWRLLSFYKSIEKRRPLPQSAL